jgi:hypothetical protein
VLALNNRRIAVYPHLTVVPRVGHAKRAFKAAIPNRSK